MSKIPCLGSPLEILLVEDSLADIELTKVGLREGKIANNLSVVRDGEEAMQFLRREGPFAEAPRPDLILLDLNLPGKDGREVLHDIKHDGIKKIPVVILTTSQAEEDVMRAYGLYANAYMTKPVDFDGFAAVVKGISDYWFTLVKLPPRA